MATTTEQPKQFRCQACRQRIDFGKDLINVQSGVHGPRGVVPLGEAAVFCTPQCVGAYFRDAASEDLPEAPRRIP